MTQPNFWLFLSWDFFKWNYLPPKLNLGNIKTWEHFETEWPPPKSWKQVENGKFCKIGHFKAKKYNFFCSRVLMRWKITHYFSDLGTFGNLGTFLKWDDPPLFELFPTETWELFEILMTHFFPLNIKEEVIDRDTVLVDNFLLTGTVLVNNSLLTGNLLNVRRCWLAKPLGAGILRWVLPCHTIEKNNESLKYSF